MRVQITFAVHCTTISVSSSMSILDDRRRCCRLYGTLSFMLSFPDGVLERTSVSILRGFTASERLHLFFFTLLVLLRRSDPFRPRALRVPRTCPNIPLCTTIWQGQQATRTKDSHQIARYPCQMSGTEKRKGKGSEGGGFGI